MRAAIYCRISRDISGESLGVNRQLDDCQALAEQLDWSVVEVYTDNDISATSGKVRPGYRKMLADIKEGRIDSIIAWHSDRLYRRVVDLTELIEICKVHDTQIATVRAGNVDLSTPAGRLMAGLLAQIYTYEGEAKSDRWKRSIRQRREAGTVHTMGPRLFGYDREGNIVPDEAEHILWAANQILDGAAIVRTCIGLNERGARTSYGNEWNRAGMVKLLRNPRLAGLSVLNGKVVGVGQWEPIIDGETFEALQAALSVRKGTVPRRPRVALLLGLIKCGKCGAALRSGTRGEKGNRKRVYRCSRLPADGGCGGIIINAVDVEDLVETFARAKAEDPRVQDYINRLSAQSGQRAGEALAVETRIRELEDQLSEPGVPVAAILRAIDRNKERLEELRAAEVHPTTVQTGGVEWPQDLARRARAVRNVVSEVTVAPAEKGWVFDPERVTITPRT